MDCPPPEDFLGTHRPTHVEKMSGDQFPERDNFPGTGVQPTWPRPSCLVVGRTPPHLDSGPSNRLLQKGGGAGRVTGGGRGQVAGTPILQRYPSDFQPGRGGSHWGWGQGVAGTARLPNI